ncbi:hypothetical protein GF369_00555, partial [Candidatus Peregrinibacteria bacterium]|nr:hypothetical protein [Candidatus Peregrinibacteria bacterium]
MLFNHSIHFLDNTYKKCLLARESKLVFRGPRGPEKSSRPTEKKETGKGAAEKKREAIKKLRKELNEGKQYQKSFETFIGNHEYSKIYKQELSKKNTGDVGIDMVIALAKELPAKVRKTKNFTLFAKSLAKDIALSTERHLSSINQNLPVTITVGPGSFLEFYNDKTGFTLRLDLKKESPRLAIIKRQMDRLKKAKEKKEDVGERIKASGHEKRRGLRQDINPQQVFDKLAHSKYLKKKGDTYIVDFKKGRRIDRVAEEKTKIQDIIDVSGLQGGNMYIRLHIDGKSPSGRRHRYWAYYHPSQKTFIREGTTKRALIFHGTKISNIDYRVSKAKKAARIKQKPKQKPKPKISEKERRENRRFGILQKNWDNVYGNEAYIFQNKLFSVPNFLQDDSDFAKYWERLDVTLEKALTDEPFNLKTTEKRRKYIQEVIQGEGSVNFDLNTRLYAEDFFETKVNGKNLYKGGYDKFVKDFHAVDKKMADLGMDYANPQNEEEKKLAKKWKKLQSIAFGIGRVFDSLSRLGVHGKKPETSRDKYQVKLLGIQTLSAREKERLGTLQYHSLKSLLHQKEDAPKGLDIGVNNDLLEDIRSMAIEYEAPDLDMQALFKAKGGLKLMFMAFGLNNLIKRGCIKKLDENHYVVVKIPQRGWGEALGTLSQNKAKLHDNSQENLKKWEEVRASLDQGRQARNFILKIFKPNGSNVKQNINFWKKLWHWDFKNKKKMSMAYAGKVTLNPKFFEKYFSSDRGYLDMVQKTSKRVEGTTLYEPQKKEVVKLCNSYLENALLTTFINARPKDLPKITNQLLREFKLEGKVKLQKPLDKKENRLANIKAIHQAISLTGLNPSTLTKAHIRLIQMGAVLQRQVETARNWNDVMRENLSSKPLYRKIQLQALRDGCPIYKLKEIEERMHLAVFGLSQSMKAPGTHTFKVKGAGVAAAVELGEWGGQKWHTSFGAALSDGRFIPFAEVGAAIKAGKKVTFKYSVGSTIGFTGASAAVEFPITSEWDMYISAGAGVSWKGASAGVGFAVGLKWNKLRAERLREKKTLNEKGVKKIDSLITQGNLNQAAELILQNPTFGEYMKAIKYKFKNPKNPQGLPNAVIVDIYQNARTQWLNAARSGVEIPAVTGLGIGVFAGASKNAMQQGVSLGAYVTFTIPYTKVNYVIRHEHPKYSEYVQSQVAQESLKKQLSKKIKSGKNVISSFTLKAQTGIVYFDSQVGRGHVARPNSKSELKKSVGIKEKDQEARISGKGSFESIKKTFANLDMHVKRVKNPKNPNQNLLAITPLQTQGSNVEMLLDPELRSKGIVLDKANNRILLAASAARRLIVTRTTYRYPFERRGADNLEVIAFKDNVNRSNIEIREDSPRYIYKYENERYAMVRGEARTGISEKQSNTMTLEQYKKRKSSYETFKERKLEYSIREGNRLRGQMSEAVGYKEQEPTRFKQLKLGQFAENMVSLFKKDFKDMVTKMDTPEAEAKWKSELFKQMKAEFKDFAKNELGNANLSINEQELNLVYTYMLNESFVALMSSSDAVIDRRLEKRNSLFKAYMKKYVKNFAETYPAKWDAIKQIDPSVTPESIANYLMLTMPQNAKQLRAFLKRKQLPITEGLKFASYSSKSGNEAFGTSYGMQMPKQFQNIFKMVGPTKLNLNSPNPRERAAARLILQVMSPLSTKNLETVEGKKQFLQSELSLLLITMY